MPNDGWRDLVAGLSAAGRDLDESTAELGAAERADGQLALLRAVNNLLGRFEVDRDAPELVPFNGWRQKFFMDNPDYRYWITDIRDDGEYHITGNVGDSVYQSVTVYVGTNIANATAVARIDTDELEADSDGHRTIGGRRDDRAVSDRTPRSRCQTACPADRHRRRLAHRHDVSVPAAGHRSPPARPA